MRNLKRALSLGLTAAMISGLMVMGSSAASYADVTSEDNVEAIDVLEAVGIMIGDENGNFNPDQNVTRNEMAVVMSNLMEYNVASYRGTSPFTDVPSWAEPYVAACWTNGITAGTSATTYGGDQTVTTAQAALMLMKALGYFQYAQDFGNDWQLATVRRGNDIGLFAGVDSGVEQAMTRNDVAQLVLNTLEAGTVQATTNGNFTIGDVTVATSVQYDFITSGESFARAINEELYTSNDGTVSTGSIVQLGEQLYRGDLIKHEDQDKFGRPANIWEYNGREIGTYEDEASFTYTAKVNSKALYNDVGRAAAENYEWFVYKNGDEVEDYGKGDLAANRSNDDDDFVALEVGGSNYTGTGVLTQVYVDNLDEEVYVSIMDTYAGEVTSVDEDSVTIRQLKPTDKANPSLDSRTFEMASPDFENGDIVLYTQASGGLMSVVAAESVSGVVNAYQVKDQNDDRDSYAELDDTRYTYSFNMVNNLENDTDEYPSGLGDDYVFYLDTYGNLIAFEGVESIDDFLFVERTHENVVGVQAYVTFADGTQQAIDVDEVRGNGNNASYEDAIEAGGGHNYGDDGVVAVNGVYTFTEDNGIYSLTALDNGMQNNEYSDLLAPTGYTNFFADNDSIIENGEGAYAIKQGHSRIYPVVASDPDGDGTYTFAETAAGSYAVNSATTFVDVDAGEVYIGYDAVPTYGAVNAVTVSNQQGVAKLVFIYNQYDKSNAGIYFFVGSDSNHNYKDGNVTIRRYDDAYIGGEKVEGGLETRGLPVLLENSIYEITSMNANDQVTDVRLVLDNVGADALISIAGGAPTGNRQALSVANHEIQLAAPLAEFQNKSIFNWDDETVFTTIETEYDRTGTVVVADVKPGDINDINIPSNNAWVYIVDVNDASNVAPTATQVFIVLVPNADDLAVVSFRGDTANYTVNGNAAATATVSAVKGNDISFNLAANTGFAITRVEDANGNVLTGTSTGTYTLQNVERNTYVTVTTEVNNSATLNIDTLDNAYITTIGGDVAEVYGPGDVTFASGTANITVMWDTGANGDNKFVSYNGQVLTPNRSDSTNNADTYRFPIVTGAELVVKTIDTYTLSLPTGVSASWNADAANEIIAGSIAANGTGEVPAGAEVTLSGLPTNGYLQAGTEYVTADASATQGDKTFTMNGDVTIAATLYNYVTVAVDASGANVATNLGGLTVSENYVGTFVVNGNAETIRFALSGTGTVVHNNIEMQMTPQTGVASTNYSSAGVLLNVGDTESTSISPSKDDRVTINSSVTTADVVLTYTLSTT